MSSEFLKKRPFKLFHFGSLIAFLSSSLGVDIIDFKHDRFFFILFCSWSNLIVFFWISFKEIAALLVVGIGIV
jgi:hypothetical protein